MKTENTHDIVVVGDGTLVLFQPLTDAGHLFLLKEVHTEPWQWMGAHLLAVDHGPAKALFNELASSGLSICIR